MKYTLSQKKISLIFAILFCLILLSPLVGWLYTRIQAAGISNTARIFFSPASSSFPTNLPLSLMLDTKSNPVGFIKITLAFDPDKINLIDEIQATDKFGALIEKTSKDVANSTGVITIVLGLSASNPPPPGVTGQFEIAQLNFGSVTTQTNQTTTVTTVRSRIQIVDTSSALVPFTNEFANIVLNQITDATPILTQIPTPTQNTHPTPPGTPSPSVTPDSLFKFFIYLPVTTNNK